MLDLRALTGPEAQKRELLELQAIYIERGLTKDLARQVRLNSMIPLSAGRSPFEHLLTLRQGFDQASAVVGDNTWELASTAPDRAATARSAHDAQQQRPDL